MLVPVILGGSLAKQFGKRFELEVSSPREAVRALCSQLAGFEQAILAHPHGFRVWVDRELLPDAQQLDRCTGEYPIRIVPMITGAKDSAVGIILGVALIMAVPYMAPIVGEGAFGTAIVSGMTGIGTSLILGGISQMLASPPKPATAANNQSNLLFSGAVNTIAQGNIVSICYGHMLVGSQVISAGIEAVQIPGVAAAISTPSLSGGGGK